MTSPQEALTAYHNTIDPAAWRIGQNKPVFVYHLITEGTVEERIHALQARKSQLADSLYGSKDTFASALTAEDISVLFEK